MPKNAAKRAAQVSYQRRLFFVMVGDMTWKMAIVIIVPIVGGYKLDQLAGTSPALIIIGFLVAMAGMFVVMARAVKRADQLMSTKEEDKQ